MTCLQPDQISVGDAGLEPGPSQPSLAGGTSYGDSAAAPEARVISAGQTRQTHETISDQITANLTVLYPDIIKYMLYNTIK